MELLAKQYNTIKNENNSNVSQIITTKQIQDVVVANSSIMRNKYSDAIKKIISLRIGGKYLRYDPAVCAILTQEYQNDNPRDSFIGAHMDFLGFSVHEKNHNNGMSIKDSLFVSLFDSIKDIKQIYIFKRDGITEYWFETDEYCEDVEEDIFRRYSIFKRKSPEPMKIIVFSKDELYDGVDISCDILLRRKG